MTLQHLPRTATGHDFSSPAEEALLERNGDGVSGKATPHGRNGTPHGRINLPNLDADTVEAIRIQDKLNKWQLLLQGTHELHAMYLDPEKYLWPFESLVTDIIVLEQKTNRKFPELSAPYKETRNTVAILMHMEDADPVGV